MLPASSKMCGSKSARQSLCYRKQDKPVAVAAADRLVHKQPNEMAGATGLEPATSAVTGQCS
ncbi:MAG: hypothetical protein WCH61_08760, partial [bacterium]